ncbi:unnamed protein product, partial [Timema podura]|nr:unnamed protein product [Timema podura]
MDSFNTTYDNDYQWRPSVPFLNITTKQDSNPDLPVISNIVYHKSNALDQGSPTLCPWAPRRPSSLLRLPATLLPQRVSLALIIPDRVGRPKRPPKDTQPRKGIYMRRPVEGACTCDGHGWEPQRDRYRCLADKERRLCSDLVALRKQMTDLCNSIMDHPCGDAETKLESLYSSDYKVKGFPNTTFRKLMAAADSPVGVPIAPLDIGLNYAYRDPTSFRYLPIVRPNVNPSRPITFGV